MFTNLAKFSVNVNSIILMRTLRHEYNRGIHEHLLHSGRRSRYKPSNKLPVYVSAQSTASSPSQYQYIKTVPSRIDWIIASSAERSRALLIINDLGLVRR